MLGLCFFVSVNLRSLCSACGSTHTESGKLYCKVKHRSPPKSFLTPTAKARPVRRRSRRSQGRGAPHTEHGLGEIRAYRATRLYTLSHELPALTALAQHTTHSHSGHDEKRPTVKCACSGTPWWVLRLSGIFYSQEFAPKTNVKRGRRVCSSQCRCVG